MKKYGEGPVLRAMNAAGMAPVFSLFLKGEGTNHEGGEITLGGVNGAHIKGNTKLTVDVVGTTSFRILMDEVKFGQDTICTEDDSYCKAVLDSGCAMIIGPKKEIDDFNKNTLSELY